MTRPYSADYYFPEEGPPEPAIYCVPSATWIFGFASLEDAQKRAETLNATVERPW